VVDTGAMTEPVPLPDRRRGPAPRPTDGTASPVDRDVLARTAARLRDIPLSAADEPDDRDDRA
jgi:hypothetical protein